MLVFVFSLLYWSRLTWSPSNFDCLNQSLWNLVCMATDPMSTAYFTDPPQQSMCFYVYLFHRCKATALLSISHRSMLGKRLGKHVPAARKIRYNIRIVDVIFYEIRVLSKVSLWACLCILPLNTVKSFPRQRRIFGSVILYAVHVVKKEIRRVFLLRTSCYLYNTALSISDYTVFNGKGNNVKLSLCLTN
jgi:hypothetical protein